MASLRRAEPERPALLAALGTLYTHGCPVAWETLYDHGGRFVRLPTYPWQLVSYWTESSETHEDRLFAPVHPLLGQRMNATHPTWELEVGAHDPPYLADHRIQDTVVLPGAAYIEMALAAAREVFGGVEHSLEGLTFRKALVLTEVADPRLRTVLRQEEAAVEVSSYMPAGEARDGWSLHMTAALRGAGSTGGCEDLDALRRGCPTHIGRDEFYERTRRRGFGYGPAFQAVQEVDVGPGRAIGRVRLPAAVRAEEADHVVHPSLLDAAFQVLLSAGGSPAEDGPVGPYLPVGIDRLRVHSRPLADMSVVVEILEADERTIVSNLRMVDADGDPLVEIEGFRARSIEASTSGAPARIDRGLYELEWPVVPGTPTGPEGAEVPGHGAGEDGICLVLADRSGVGEALARQLGSEGEPAVTVSPDEVPELWGRSGHDDAVGDGDPDQVCRLLVAVAGGERISRVIHLWSLDAVFLDTAPPAVLDRDQRTGALSVAHLMRALAHSGWPQLPRVWLVTRRAQAVGETPGPTAIAQAPVWGLGRVIGHQEFTGMWGGLIDLDTGPAAEQAALLREEIRPGQDEDQVAFRDGHRHVARLAPSTRLTPPLPPSFRADGSYLITGGFGSLGLLVARFLVQHGAGRLILMGRSAVPERSTWPDLGPDHPHQGLVEELLALERQGATLHLAAVDVADENELATWLEGYEREMWPPIRGVVHTAGVVQDELLVRMSTETFERVLRPKVRGGWLLHHLLRDQPLDLFVLFSSTASVIASPGQGNYAAGNAFLDALAHHRRALGLPAIAIGWGPWAVGMVERLGLEELYARRGIELITPEGGMQILARVLEQRPAQLTAITANWATARETSPTGTSPPMFSWLTEHDDAAGGPDEEGAAPSLLSAVRAAPRAERADVLTAGLRDVVALVLQLDPAGLAEREPLTGLGMDSMMAIEVKHRIEAATEVDVPVLELLQGATVVSLAGRVLAVLEPDGGAPDAGDAAGADPAGPAPSEDGPSAEEIEQLIAQASDVDLDRLLRELERDVGESRTEGHS